VAMSDHTWPRVRQELLDALGPGFDPVRLNLESRLREDLGVNSLKTVDLIVSFEDIFDIAISDDDLAKLVTVRDVVRAIDQRLGAESG
jgi:acyl carrier protein